jgi:DNA repair protein RadA/Sms
MGKCPECGSWGSFVEEIEKIVKSSNPRSSWVKHERETPIPITEIGSHQEERRKTGLREFDRVLGGGVVKGSVSLISGEHE